MNLSVTHEHFVLVLVAAFVQECTSQKPLFSLVSPCRWRSSRSKRRLTRMVYPSHPSMRTRVVPSGAFILHPLYFHRNKVFFFFVSYPKPFKCVIEPRSQR